MKKEIPHLPQTASQTAGPYVHIGLAPEQAGFSAYAVPIKHTVADPGSPGVPIRIEGSIVDGDGALVKDALIELWQADAQGHFIDTPQATSGDTGFRGWGRAVCDFVTGEWHIDTIKPGAWTDPDGERHAPHLCLWIVARGINIGLHTRVYFDDETEANATDPVLTSLSDTARVDTLIARRVQGTEPQVYRFDICLLGAAETVFFDV